MAIPATTEKMFINARNPEELRIAIVKDQRVNDVVYEHPGQELQKGNICKAKITHREKSLNAVFARYSDQEGIRDGFLPKNEILPEYFHNPQGKPFEQLSVEDIPEGLEIIVQVDKEERGTKGAALTTYISLAGRYLVLMPKNPGAGGISRRIEGEDRSELREVLNQLTLPEDAGAIIRTAGVGKSFEDLQWDLDVLLKVWQAILDVSKTKSAPFLIHQESDVIGRVVRDYLRQGISEIWVDSKDAWEKVREHVLQQQPDFINHVKLYDDIIPLFNRYHIERQLEATFERVLELPNRGNIVIDHTEALVAIDVNSAKATRGRDIEETARLTNIDAAKEIARQLRLRDINGIVVIDFIDMAKEEHKREVENILREEVKHDRARIQIGRISKFGLVEMSRQRLRPSLKESSTITCPRCSGQGRVHAIEPLSLKVLRLISEEAINKKIVQVEAQLPVSVATYLLNEKRADLYEIEKFYQTRILLIPNEFVETPYYRVVGRTREELKERTVKASYRLVEQPVKSFENEPHSLALSQSEPALKTVSLDLPLPPRSKRNLFQRIRETVETIFGATDSAKTPTSPTSSGKGMPPTSSSMDNQGAARDTMHGAQRRGGSGSSSKPSSTRKAPRENVQTSLPSEEEMIERGSDTTRTKQQTVREQGTGRQNFGRDRYDRRRTRRTSSTATMPPTSETMPTTRPTVTPEVEPEVTVTPPHVEYVEPEKSENLPQQHEPKVKTHVEQAEVVPVREAQHDEALPAETALDKVEDNVPSSTSEAAVEPTVAKDSTEVSDSETKTMAADDRASRSRRYPRSHAYSRRHHHMRGNREATAAPVAESKQESFFNNEEAVENSNDPGQVEPHEHSNVAKDHEEKDGE